PPMRPRSTPGTCSTSSPSRSTRRRVSSLCRRTTRSSRPRWCARTAAWSHEAEALLEEQRMPAMTPATSVFYLTVFVLPVFLGYHVIWNVTPALHTPLMSLTNAISSIILVGAMLAAGSETLDWGGWLGVLAVALVSINTFGGFLVTQRMLEMFRKKEPKTGEKE